MDDIRGDADIIKLANNVCFLYRLPNDNIELDFVKVRHPAGRQGSTNKLHFNLDKMKLTEFR